MKKTSLVVMLVVLALATAASASPVTVWTSAGQFAPNIGSFVKPVTFDCSSYNPCGAQGQGVFNQAGINYQGDFAIVNGSQPNLDKSPTGDLTNYISSPDPNGQTTSLYTITPDKTYNYFGLYWGSLDAYNHISFYKSGNLIESLTPADFDPAHVDGNTSEFVNFIVDGGYDRIDISSTQYAFESDNHSFGQTPEPGSLALLGSGLVGLAGMLRRRFVR